MRILIGLLAIVGVGLAQTSLDDQVVQALKQAQTNIQTKQQAGRGIKEVDPNDPAFMDTQIANDISKAAQSKGAVLLEATKILVAKNGVGILDKLAGVNVTALMSKTGIRKKRQSTSNCGGNLPCNNPDLKTRRTIDGRCNSPTKEFLGAANTMIRRLLNQASYADGFNEMRTLSIFGTPLPNARNISNKLMAEAPVPVFDATVNHLHMQFGQFIAHDVIFMPSSTSPTGKTLDCNSCSSPSVDENCAPVKVPEDDDYFFAKAENGQPKCLRFTRALNAQETLGQRTPRNQNTHFLDLSVVYGSEECEGASVRSFVNGELKVLPYNHPLPPQDRNDTNCQSRTTFPCFRCGDFRNSLHPGLVPLHTVFILEHNRLAKQFAKANPTWKDEKLFQEARRANIAQYQNIVYTEYLPPLLGEAMMTKFGIKTSVRGSVKSYNTNFNPTITGEFSAAAFRFGHSQARREFPRLNNAKMTIGSPVDIGNNIFYAESQYEKLKTGTSAMIEGMIQSPAMKVDNQFSFPIRNQLFEIRNKVATGVDLVAVNIMRGRDIGLFPYVDYRILVGLKRVFKWADLMPEIPSANVELLKKMYADPADIDLYVGILMETPMPGALVGPTAGYIIGEQFSALKRGDRWYFEHREPELNSLTDSQLDAVKRIQLNALICMNSAGMEMTNRDIFLMKSTRVRCDSLLPLDVSQF